ncbi:MAG: glycosyltransferase family 4 protein [Tepidisphaeraceae bacterium]
MKLAYLVNQYPQPSQTFIRREIAALEARGIDVQRYTVRRWGGFLVDAGDQAEAARTRTVLDTGATGLVTALLGRFFFGPVWFLRALALALKLGRKSDRGVLFHLIYLAEACVLLKWLRQANVTHVHAHFGTNSTTVALLCNALGGPTYSFTCHGPEEFDRPETLKLGEKIARAAFVVAISDYGRSQLFRWCAHEHWSKIHVVHCGLDGMFLQTPPTSTPGSPRLVCVGRLSEQKGQLLLVEAAARLLEEGMNFELVLVGDGPMRGEIESLVRTCRNPHAIKLAGWMDNTQVRQEILNSRAMVLPSFAEGLPVVIMESLALGRPVISTYVAGIPELVEDGVCGWLVPAGSVEALVGAMRAALKASTQQLDEMGREGARRVRERHDAATEASKLAELFPMPATECAPTPRSQIALVPSPGTPGEG